METVKNWLAENKTKIIHCGCILILFFVAGFCFRLYQLKSNLSDNGRGAATVTEQWEQAETNQRDITSGVESIQTRNYDVEESVNRIQQSISESRNGVNNAQVTAESVTNELESSRKSIADSAATLDAAEQRLADVEREITESGDLVSTSESIIQRVLQRTDEDQETH